MIGKAELERLLPHKGDMVLLDAITEWSQTHILCTSESHLLADNPLRRAEGLSVIAGIEYGMQAMAAHGSLIDARKNRPGYLASLRDVRLAVSWLHDITGPLTVGATVILQDPNNVVYSFVVSSGNRELLAGRAGVFLK